MSHDYYRADEITPAGYAKRPEPKPYPAWKLCIDLLLLAAAAVIVGLSLGG